MLLLINRQMSSGSFRGLIKSINTPLCFNLNCQHGGIARHASFKLKFPDGSESWNLSAGTTFSF